MRATFLGTGSAMPTGDRVQTGILLEADGRRLLVDCGSGVLHRLASTEVGYEGVSTVLLTHHHLDHVADLLPLLKARWLAGEEHLEVVGPRGTKALVDSLLGAFDYLEGRVDLAVREVGPHEFEVAGFAVDAMETRHSIPCLAYRLTPGGGTSADGEEGEADPAGEGAADGAPPTFTYSGDSEAFPALCSFADGSAVFAHDCSFPDEVDVSNHPTPAKLGEALAAADPDVGRVYLTHLYPHTEGNHREMLDSVERRYDGEVRFARDLQTVTVE